MAAKIAKKLFHKDPKRGIFFDMNQKRFARIGDILPAVLKSIGLDKRIRERELLSIWPDVVGEEIAARTEAVNIDHGVLYVHVEHSAWIQELHFMETELLRKLRAEVPGVELKKIRFGTMK
jgi:predicted nucleic acid-binding Zn ribbon protein